jgi:hypothetical protein
VTSRGESLLLVWRLTCCIAALVTARDLGSAVRDGNVEEK